MANLALVFDMLARDRATPALRNVGKAAENTGKRLKTAGDEGDKAGRRIGGGLSVASKAVGAAGAIFAGVSLAGFFREASAEARESVKVGKVTAQVIKSTGGAAKITADQVGTLATSISNATGRDDELVQSGANLLLTFKNVRNEVGKGNQIFNRATAAAVDLSATGFGSVAGSSKMLGKALNDPVKGISALSRAGVTFSEQQKTQIARMVESGNVLGAQKIILAEVESQVGGVAAASADASEKYAVASGNFKELVGTALKPVGDAFYNVMTQRVFPALSEAVRWLQVRVPAGITFVKTAFFGLRDLLGRGDFTAAFRTAFRVEEDSPIVGFLLKVREGVGQVARFVRSDVVPALRGLGGFITGTLLPAWAGWYSFLFSQMMPIIRQVGGFVRDSIIPAFRVVASFIAREVVPGFLSIVETVKGLIRVVAPIIGQIVGVILGKFREMRPQIQSIWGSVKEIITGVMFVVREVISTVTKIIKGIWDRWGTQIKAIVGAVFGAIFDIVSGLMKAIAGIIKTVVALIKGDWKGAWEGIKQIFSGVWQAIKGVLKAAWTVIKTIFAGAIASVKASWQRFWDGVVTTLREEWGIIKGAVSAAWTSVKTTFTNAQTSVRGKWDSFWTGIKNGARSAMDWAHTKISGVLGKIRGAFDTAKTNIQRIWDGVKGVVSAPIEWVKNNVYNRPLVPVWNRVAGLVDGPKLSTYATGGVHGVRPGYTPGRDTHLIGVGGGEAIMRPEWTRAAGKDYVDQANAAARRGGARRFIDTHGLPGFAGGGVVGWIKDRLGGAADFVSGVASKIKGFVVGSLRAAAGAILNPLKGVIDRNMPGSRVGRTVGGIGKKAVDLLLAKIGAADDAAVAIPGGQGITGPAGGIMSFKGGRFTSLAVKNLRRAEQIAGVPMRVMQGGFRPTTSYSGTSHRGDAVDTQASAALIRGLRSVGWASGDRTGLGNWGSHAHSVPSPSTGRAGGSAVWQYQDYVRRGGARQSLRSPWGLADGALVRGGRGGVLAAVGEGPRDELVTPLPKSWRSGRGDDKIDRLIAAIEKHGLSGHTFQFGDVHNPREEPLSQTANRVLQRVAALPLV